MYKVCILGNLTANPTISEREYTNTVTGEIIKAKVCNFTVAADDGFGERKKTSFFHVSVWRGLAETCAKYLTKGRAVYVEGPVSLNNYVGTDKQLHSVMDVRGDVIQFIGKGKEVETPSETAEEEPMPY